MTDLIDRQALLKDIERYHLSDGKFQHWVEVQPSVDAVEVVRCKDCKYFDSGTDEDGKLFFKCLGWVYGGTSEDDFCSHGERKDGIRNDKSEHACSDSLC